MMFRSSLRSARHLNVRYNSTMPKPIQRTTTSRIRELFKSPTFKSVFLTFVFGTVVVETMKNRKELEQLESRYATKFGILEDAIARLKRGESIDVTKELNLANTLTRGKYNVITDIELDEELEEFLKIFQEPILELEKEVKEEAVKVKQEVAIVKEEIEKAYDIMLPAKDPKKVETSKFL